VETRIEKLDLVIARLDAALASVTPNLPAGARAAIERWRADA